VLRADGNPSIGRVIPAHLARGTDDDALSPSPRRLAESVRRHRRSAV